MSTNNNEMALREYANQLRKRIEQIEKAIVKSEPVVKRHKKRWLGRKGK